MKKLIKYGSRVVLGLITAFLGLGTYCELTPVGDGPCEAGQKGPDPLSAFLYTLVSLLLFSIVWYKTKDW